MLPDKYREALPFRLYCTRGERGLQKKKTARKLTCSSVIRERASCGLQQSFFPNACASASAGGQLHQTMMPRCWASIVSFCVFLCVSLYLRPAGACEMDFIDAKSRNDNLTTSTYVALPMMASPLTICPPGDKDFFRWKLEKNTTLTFAITCDTPELQVCLRHILCFILLFH